MPLAVTAIPVGLLLTGWAVPHWSGCSSLVGLLPGAAAPPPVDTRLNPQRRVTPQGAPEARYLYNPLRKLWDAGPLRPPTRGKLRSMRASPQGASLGGPWQSTAARAYSPTNRAIPPRERRRRDVCTTHCVSCGTHSKPSHPHVGLLPGAAAATGDQRLHERTALQSGRYPGTNTKLTINIILNFFNQFL